MTLSESSRANANTSWSWRWALTASATLAALGHDLVVGLLLLGGHLPVLGLGQLGDLTGLGQLGADLGDPLL